MDASRPRTWSRPAGLAGCRGLPIVVAVLLAIGGAWLAGCAVDVGPPRADAPAPSSPDTSRSGLPEVRLSDLPPEVGAVLDVVGRGGPYDHPQDDQVFGNREGLLPAREHGYYREYTVPTPGESDRGARRLVVGEDGDVYYTADHYQSFRQVRW